MVFLISYILEQRYHIHTHPIYLYSFYIFVYIVCIHCFLFDLFLIIIPYEVVDHGFKFYIYSLSILVTDTTYVIFGIINDLTSIFLLTIATFLFFQEFIFFSDFKSCFSRPVYPCWSIGVVLVKFTRGFKGKNNLFKRIEKHFFKCTLVKTGAELNKIYLCIASTIFVWFIRLVSALLQILSALPHGFVICIKFVKIFMTFSFNMVFTIKFSAMAYEKSVR